MAIGPGSIVSASGSRGVFTVTQLNPLAAALGATNWDCLQSGSASASLITMPEAFLFEALPAPSPAPYVGVGDIIRWQPNIVGWAFPFTPKGDLGPVRGIVILGFYTFAAFPGFTFAWTELEPGLPAAFAEISELTLITAGGP